MTDADFDRLIKRKERELKQIQGERERLESYEAQLRREIVSLQADWDRKKVVDNNE